MDWPTGGHTRERLLSCRAVRVGLTSRAGVWRHISQKQPYFSSLDSRGVAVWVHLEQRGLDGADNTHGNFPKQEHGVGLVETKH